MITRRDCLRAGGWAAGALAAAGCTPLVPGWGPPELAEQWASFETGMPEDGALLQMLRRTTFGLRPGDLQHVRQIGWDAYVEEQLYPDKLDESTAVAWRLWPLDTLQVDTDFRFEFPKEQVQAELQQAAVIRATYSRRQLHELMVEFWSDHFNISQLKGDSAFLKTADDDAVMRRHALGRFRDLLLASARSPAMLHYLDNARNTKSAVNENYARELMELHTLGLGAGYTQRDVQEVARCFTGWSIQDERTWWHGEFVFHPDQHDNGVRQILRLPLSAGLGRKHGERVLEFLADHPSTARHIARKLCRRFIADEGAYPGALVERLAQTFRHTDGDIRAVMGLLLRSPEFRRGGRKLKRPFDFAISALRAVDADTNGAGILPHLHRMGQPPFGWAMPNGYPDQLQVWLPSLLGRWNFAAELVSGRLAGAHVDLEALVESAGARSPDRQAAVLQSAILGRADRRITDLLVGQFLGKGRAEGLAQAAALLLASPDFQWR